MLSEKRILPASNNILIERRRLQISIKLMGAIFIIKVYLLNLNISINIYTSITINTYQVEGWGDLISYQSITDKQFKNENNQFYII